ncbi:MAG TPA: efflux RND transporter periplasmic adaptor subunit [Casimicrobiaceae bacterium]|nr:efflux RND transporter periplasmic adaptor subunit [Casimicrobiaceae bacterium]
MSEQRHDELVIHSLDDDDSTALHSRTQVARRARLLILIVLVLLGAGAARTVISRISSERALEQGTTERAKVYVNVTAPIAGGQVRTLSLPATLQGNMQSPISARASGYLRRWYKDIGARVQKGELLAEIETPEIDQQLSQAIAARQQAAASLDIARSTSERWESLRKRDAVSQQEVDERRSTYAQAQANLAAADANVERLRQLEAFKRVVAPFSGVITRRNVDVGDLIDAGSSGGRALFQMAQSDPLRVYINVPQASANLVRVGQKVNVIQPELQGRTFEGEIARTAASIDTTTRTMQVEVTLPNRNGELLPGAYVQVLLPLAASKSLSVPMNALMIRGDGIRVATVSPEGRVHLQPVHVGRNYGESIEVLEGLSGNEHLVLNPSDSLAEGDQVVVATPDAARAKRAEASK